MSFGVFVRIRNITIHSIIDEVIPWGEFPKPVASQIPGAPKKNVTNRCHIIAWDLYTRSFATRFMGRSILEIATYYGYTGPQEPSPMMAFIEGRMKSQIQQINTDATLYYNGKASENTSSGALYRAAKENCDRVYNQWAASNPNMQTAPPHLQQQRMEVLRNNIREYQWNMFRYGYDDPPPNLFSAEQIRQYRLQYIQVYQGLITGQNPELYYRYIYGIDTHDFVQQAMNKMGV